MRLDLLGTINCCQHAIPAIVRGGGGAVVNMSSGAALRGASPAHIYTAAKGGIVSLTRALAGTYAKNNVRVNAICAGRILTERILSRFGTPDAPKPAEDQQADQRVREYPFWVGKPEDIANIALFLASDEVPYDHRCGDPGGWRPLGVLAAAAGRRSRQGRRRSAPCPRKCWAESRSPSTKAPSTMALDRDQKGDEQQVGGAGGGQDAEIEDVGRARWRARRGRGSRPWSAARHGKRPRPVDQQHQRQQQDGRGRDLTGRGRPSARRRAVGSAGRTRRRRRRTAPPRARRAAPARPSQVRQSAGPDHHHDTD